MVNNSKPSLLSTLLAMMSTPATASSHAAFANIQCNEKDALLRVKFHLNETEWDAMRTSDTYLYPELEVHPSGNVGNLTNVYYQSVAYQSYDDVTDFELCAPRDGACLEMTISMFPTDSYEISWDGQVVEIGQEFPYWYEHQITSTELGDFCFPTCDKKTEALFEYEYWSGSQHSGDDWFVKDTGSDEMILGCDDSNYSLECRTNFYRLFKYRACLPRKTCHQFVTGSGSGWQWIPGIHDNTPSFAVYYDGNLIEQSDSWLFKSVMFGDDCQSLCDEESESLIEFYLTKLNFDYGCESDEYDVSWQLSLSDNINGSLSDIDSGIISGCYDDFHLTYESFCVTKDSCVTFDISPKSNESLYPALSLIMDDKTYRKGRWFGLSSAGLNQTTNMGSCTVESLCNSNQALFELELVTSAETSYQAIYTHDIDWKLDYHEYDKRNSYWDPLLSETDYITGDYDLGSEYRTIECVPSTECELDFNMSTASPVDRYVVKRNGVELSHEVREEWEVTPFGEECTDEKSSSKLSGGAIAGIVIACVAVVAAAVIGYMWYKKSQASAVEEGEDNTLTDDLLTNSL